LLHQYCQWPQQQKKKRKEEAYPWKAGTSSGHITNLKQSILDIRYLWPAAVNSTDLSTFTKEVPFPVMAGMVLIFLLINKVNMKVRFNFKRDQIYNNPWYKTGNTVALYKSGCVSIGEG